MHTAIMLMLMLYCAITAAAAAAILMTFYWCVAVIRFYFSHRRQFGIDFCSVYCVQTQLHEKDIFQSHNGTISDKFTFTIDIKCNWKRSGQHLSRWSHDKHINLHGHNNIREQGAIARIRSREKTRIRNKCLKKIYSVSILFAHVCVCVSRSI